jgi:hypothetical protein
VRFFTDFPILTSGDEDIISAMDVSKIIDPIMRPHRIPNGKKVDTVVLDPGHGGTDQGAANQWGTEKGFALDVALSASEQPGSRLPGGNDTPRMWAFLLEDASISRTVFITRSSSASTSIPAEAPV